MDDVFFGSKAAARQLGVTTVWFNKLAKALREAMGDELPVGIFFDGRWNYTIEDVKNIRMWQQARLESRYERARATTVANYTREMYGFRNSKKDSGTRKHSRRDRAAKRR